MHIDGGLCCGLTTQKGISVVDLCDVIVFSQHHVDKNKYRFTLVLTKHPSNAFPRRIKRGTRADMLPDPLKHDKRPLKILLG